METVSGQCATLRRREGARGRRERRLRAEARIRLQLCRDAVRIASHRGGEGYKAGGEARVALYGHVPEAPLTQGWVLRHVVGHLPVPALDVPVPQMVDQLPDIEQFFRALSPDPEQVIEVPKILPLDVPMRAALRVTQLVEQLVEVPTILSYSSLLQRTVEQHVDIPVPSGGGGPSSGLQGFSSGQRSTASPSSKKRISERIVEQIVDPVSSGRLQGSSSSHSPAGGEERADEPGKGFFSHFSPKYTSAKLGSHSGSELLPESSPSTRAAQLEDSVEWVRLRDVNSGKTNNWNRRTFSTVWKPPSSSSWVKSCTASPGRYINTRRAAYPPMTMQRHVPAVLRASWPVWTRRTVAVVCTRRVLMVTMHLALCSLPWLAGKGANCGVSAVAVHRCRRHLCHGAQADSHGR